MSDLLSGLRKPADLELNIEAGWYNAALDDVRAAVDADRLIAGCRHADWCCTKGCAQPNGVHYVGDWNEVPLDGDQTGLQKFAPCPGTCTCEVAPIVHQVVQQLTGGNE